MAFKIVHDGTDARDPAEHCAFCWNRTRYWHEPSDVAVCPTCAGNNKVSDIPSKQVWCAMSAPPSPKEAGQNE